MSPPASVLIVERSADEREVLRTALERRGLRIFEAAEAATGLTLAREHHPDVIVLDLDGAASDGDRLHSEFDRSAAADHASLIILGKAACPPRLPADQVIAKPYHFAPLVHKIQQLAAKAA